MTDAVTSDSGRKRAKAGPRSPKTKKVGGRGARSVASGGVAREPSTKTQVAELAGEGHHTQAIDLATRALGQGAMDVAAQLDLLDLRAESLIAVGDLVRADADATTMVELASAAKKPALKAQALNRRALVQMRRNDFKAGLSSATAALKSARSSGKQRLIAMSLFRLAEAQYRAEPNPAVLKNAMEAAKLFRTLGDRSGEGRALWVVAMYRGYEGRAADCNRAAEESLALCRGCGDRYGAGNALNMMLFHEADLATALKVSSLALADFEAAGYIDRQAVVMGNRGVTYGALGLHRRARRLVLKTQELHHRTGATLAAINASAQMADAELEMGHPERARAHAAEMAKGLAATPSALHVAGLRNLQGRLALIEGEPATALARFDSEIRIAKESSRVAIEIDGLTGAADAYLALGKPRPALAATRRATELHKEHDLTPLDGMSPVQTWWQHSRALRANKKDGPAREALEMAYGFVLKGIASLSDEGLRRNYLNKIRVHRQIVGAWLADARKRRLSQERRTAHLAGEANLREPFQRLVEAGLRLNELRSAEELHEFLIDEATELSGAERVLLVLETPEGLRPAGSLMPPGEDASVFLNDIASALTEVRRTRTVSLAYTPASATALEQRSRIIAPLIAQRNLLGFLYADIQGAFGRFRESDRDLLGMLASQAAVALDNAQWSQDLEQKVAERTEELRASNAQLEQRASELAIINSIQQGIAAELDFQAIVDLVGDKLREVFHTGDLGIRWYDPEANLIHFVYQYEHGTRFHGPPRPPSPGGPWSRLSQTRQPVVANNLVEKKALGFSTVPGTDTSISAVSVPILGSDRVLGTIALEDYERENAFGEAEVRLLSTVAASMGVALENARLFDETQRLFKAEQERAAELQIINSIQQGLASKLDLQAIVDLVGEKLRDILNTDDIGIRLYDEQTDLIYYLYEFEHGERLALSPRAPSAMFRQQQADRMPIFGSTSAIGQRFKLGLFPGTEQSKAIASVPIVAGAKVIGGMSVESFER
ncbi:MAG TPA: GAF domain-containing protein, partial [Casimicrobiaceae bacterium]|nr:GAF domain-containing protein [Casimicrobiaceae bacterium]